MKLHEIKTEIAKMHNECYGWVLNYCNNHDDAMDILQTVYIKIIEGKAVFNGKSNFKTWIFSVIRNTSIDYLRKNSIKRLFSLSKVNENATTNENPISIEANERNKIMHALLSKLSLKQREILHLVFYQGMTIEEAAEVLNVSLGTARTHYERGKKRMKELIIKWGYYNAQ